MDYRFFTPKTEAVFRAVAACIVPDEPGAPGADSDAAIGIVDHALSLRPARDRRLLETFLKLLELLPLLSSGRRFTRLERERQRRFLRSLETNRWAAKLRQGFFGVKTFALLGYYGLPQTWQQIGYPGPRTDAPRAEPPAQTGAEDASS